jgi:hypothetical protein
MQMTLRSMSDKDLNEQLIRKFMEYSRWSNRFELFGYKEAAVKARNCLREIQQIANARYHEIRAKKHALYDNQNEGDEEASNDN